VLIAVIAASASAALPEYKECAKVKHTGAFKEGNCAKESPTHEGDYEILSGLGSNTAFKASAATTAFELEGSEGLRCKSAKIAGETSGTKEQRGVVMTFKDCEMFGHGCTTEGEPLATVKTAPLKGVLGYISRSPLRVGIVYTAEAPGGYWAEAQCEAFSLRWKGSALGEVKDDINEFSSESTDVFSTDDGVPEHTSFEGGTPGEFTLSSEIDQDGSWEGEGSLGFSTDAAVKGETLMIAA